ncbi:ABC transporter ATP-binding protein [Sedimentibacter hydroxybenzoicus DSM 7310]|uniref:ABC transporter ATP-binding protein n=1 Tax=Sedimentibacter hydroxybenzoicus DSM 7310 TaxID=1123245 RepID=A0A974BMC2_SEDHY|nr:ABC transporter ATP-binding protein [Sedimentibacter hydroxybenzoicus]NYB75702.1 ABC transporter ATP-binding protein [Sedimentibacter hydroxybenzoicus DSM 7310]
MGEVLIKTENLGISFGAHKAVSNMNLELEEKVFTTILGPNGAGKTTLFNLISGLLKPTEGKIYFKGTDITCLSPVERVKMGMGRSFQLTNVFPNLTVYENVRLAVQSKENIGYRIFVDHRNYTSINQKADELLEKVLLSDKKSFIASKLSHTEQRKLELGMVLALEPEALLLDEPTAGMAIEEVPTMIEILAKIKKTGTTVILIEHKMDMVKALSDKLIIIVNGMKLIEGEPEAVSKHPEVLKAYLGGGVIDGINT